MTLAPQHQTTLDVTFPASLASVAEARRHLAEWLHGAGVADPDLHDDLALVLSELAANAARAAQVHDSTFSVQAAVQDGAVVLRVGNPADVWVPPTHRWDMDDPLRGGGRGLQIVSALVDELRVEQDLTRERTVVTAVTRIRS